MMRLDGAWWNVGVPGVDAHAVYAGD